MKVLVATDGSEKSMRAVAMYAKGTLEDMPPGIQSKLEAEAAQALNKSKALFEAKGLKVDLALEAGTSPANNIVRKAEEAKVDLILVGSTGVHGLGKLLMGSTASKVAANAPCMVTVVR
jgi:nucleotide-binding universal stress UspA family protein